MRFISTVANAGEKLEFEMDFDPAFVQDVEAQPGDGFTFDYYLTSSYRLHGLPDFRALKMFFSVSMGYKDFDAGGIFDVDDEESIPQKYLPYLEDGLLQFDVIASDSEKVQLLLEVIRKLPTK